MDVNVNVWVHQKNESGTIGSSETALDQLINLEKTDTEKILQGIQKIMARLNEEEVAINTSISALQASVNQIIPVLGLVATLQQMLADKQIELDTVNEKLAADEQVSLTDETALVNTMQSQLQAAMTTLTPAGTVPPTTAETVPQTAPADPAPVQSTDAPSLPDSSSSVGSDASPASLGSV